MGKKVLVVGAGIIGSAIADRLQAEGCTVTVFEGNLPAGGCTSTGLGAVPDVRRQSGPAGAHQLELAPVAGGGPGARLRARDNRRHLHGHQRGREAGAGGQG